jgi:hypothetical protein
MLAVGYTPPISRVFIYDIKGDKIIKVGDCKGSTSRI